MKPSYEDHIMKDSSANPEDPFANVLNRGRRELQKIVTELVSFEFRSIELNIERLLYKDLSQGSRICILMT